MPGSFIKFYQNHILSMDIIAYIKCLFCKMNITLKNSHEFSKLWLQSAKSHAERLIELNSITMLEMLPGRIGTGGAAAAKLPSGDHTDYNAKN